ncbi:hypothetical protein D3C84_1257750 [compost metagenome]
MVSATPRYFTASSMQAPSCIWPTVERYSSCHGVWLAGTAGMPSALRAASTSSVISISQLPVFRSMRMVSPVRT